MSRPPNPPHAQGDHLFNDYRPSFEEARNELFLIRKNDLLSHRVAMKFQHMAQDPEVDTFRQLKATCKCIRGKDDQNSAEFSEGMQVFVHSLVNYIVHGGSNSSLGVIPSNARGGGRVPSDDGCCCRRSGCHESLRGNARPQEASSRSGNQTGPYTLPRNRA
jgi:hypothetical protein